MKLIFSGSALVGVVSWKDPALLKTNEKETKIETIQTGDITTFEDVEIYAKKNGCSFIFVNAWSSGEIYNSEKFVENRSEQKEEWKKKIWEGAKKSKDLCKEGKSLVFVHTNSFVIKQQL